VNADGKGLPYFAEIGGVSGKKKDNEFGAETPKKGLRVEAKVLDGLESEHEKKKARKGHRLGGGGDP